MSNSLDRLRELLENRSGQSPLAWMHLPSSDQNDGRRPLSYYDLLNHLSKFDDDISRPNRNRGSDSSATEEEFRKLIEQVSLLQSCHAPIIAIVGVLNAGKTSLVASLLSGAARSRLLIGQSNREGTHRFVIWLPQSWQHLSTIWDNLQRQLESIFGFPPEPLSNDSREAAEQYNGYYSASFKASYPACLDQRPIRVPLIAFDSALDNAQIGLMDCPDIQTGYYASEDNDSSNIESNNLTEVQKAKPLGSTEDREDAVHALVADERLETLKKSLTFASAFIVVMPANAMQEQTVATLLSTVDRTMSSLKKIIAVNKVPRRYDAADIAHEIDTGYRNFHCWRTYMAYHFDGPQLREKLPTPTTLPFDRDSKDALLPCFWRIDHRERTQPPKAIPQQDYLHTIGTQLDQNALLKEQYQSLTQRTQYVFGHSIDALGRMIANIQKRQRSWHQVIANTVFELARPSAATSQTSTGEHPRTLRLQFSHEILSQVAQSMERTAPWWAYPSIYSQKFSKSIKTLASQSTTYLKLPSVVARSWKSWTATIRKQWMSGQSGSIVTAQHLFEMIKNRDRHGELIDATNDHFDQQYLTRLDNLLRRFQVESAVRLSEEELDELTTKAWSEMSLQKKLWTGFVSPGMMFAPIFAVILIPIDFGGSAILLAATGKELLIAALAGLGLSLLSRDSISLDAKQEAAFNQLSELFLIGCDELGIERPREMPSVPFEKGYRQLSLVVARSHSVEPVDSRDQIIELNKHVLGEIRQCLLSLAED